MESIKNFTNAADMLAAWNSGDFEFTVEAMEGHKISTRFGKVVALERSSSAGLSAGTSATGLPIRYSWHGGVWRSPSGARQLVVRRKSDRVKIVRKIPDYHEGWDDVWVDGMDCLFGEERTIESINPKKKECRLLATMWNWPLAALERVEAKAAHTKAPPASPVLPSDEAGIEAMVKRMLGQHKSAPPAAPAPQKPPFYKGLLIQASEKYMGLGFNGEDRQ